jgi:prephenate dehydrogenase
MSTLQWKHVTVVGCGLMGASFALALKKMFEQAQAHTL